MSGNDAVRVFNWRSELPMLCGSVVTLREPVAADVSRLADVLSLPDAARFDLIEPVSGHSVLRFVERAALERAAGAAFTYVIGQASTGDTVGLVQVRQMDPIFEGATWEFTLAPSARGTGAFVDAAQLVGSFAFASVGARRLEARIDVDNARAKAALRKIGAVQEGILRRSMRRGDDYVDQALWAVLMETWEYSTRPAVLIVH
jgi:RimJ/RimL family protein N-acetyltransferase